MEWGYWSKKSAKVNAPAQSPAKSVGISSMKKEGKPLRRTSWCMIMLLWRHDLKCFAKVVFPEHVAPLFSKFCQVKKRCVDNVERGYTYPTAIVITLTFNSSRFPSIQKEVCVYTVRPAPAGYPLVAGIQSIFRRVWHCDARDVIR